MSHRRAPSDWLAHNTYLVAGGLAVFCIAAVFAIASYDQLLGTERFCYRWLTGDGAEETVCRDSERSCTYDRERRCEGAAEGAASPCVPHGEQPGALARCHPTE